MATVPNIPDTDRILDATATAGQTQFAIIWPVFGQSLDEATADLVVVIGAPLDPGAFTFQGTPITGLSGIWNGGTVTLETACAGGERVIIYSDRAPRRIGAFLEGKSLPFSTLDQLLDDMAAQARDLELRGKRAITISIEDFLDGVDPDNAASDLTAAAAAAVQAAQVAGSDLWSRPTLSVLAAPPDSPTLGDRHLVAHSGTSGAFAGFEDQVAQWDGTDWLFSGAPKAGQQLVDASSGANYVFGTSWKTVSVWLSKAPSIDTASAAAFAASCPLSIDTDYTLTADTALSADVRFDGGKITRGAHALGFTGAFSASGQQCFDADGTGLVTIATASDIHLGWFLDLDADDDSSAMDAAEASAHATGATLHWSRAKTLKYDGSHAVRVNVKGHNATVQQIAATAFADVGIGLVQVSAAGITLEDFTTDCQFLSGGVVNIGNDAVTYRNVAATNCIDSGFHAEAADRVVAYDCRASGIKYRQSGVAGLPADGFYWARCSNSGADGCHAEDCRRIGFVGEGNATTLDGEGIFFRNLTGKNFNNCDDSTTEFNAFVWVEDCNSGTIENVRGEELAGNTGQTSGRVAGVVIGGGQIAPGIITGRNIDIRGTNGNMPVGVSIIASAAGSNDIALNGVFVQAAVTGVKVGNTNAQSLRLENILLDQLDYAAASNGGILFDVSGSTNLVSVTIDNLRETNNVAAHNDSATINWFSANTLTRYFLRNLVGPTGGGATHIMRGACAAVTVEDSVIAAGTDTYQSFCGNLIDIKKTVIGQRTVTLRQNIFGNLNAGSLVRFDDCDIRPPSGTWVVTLSGTSVSHSWRRCTVDNTQFLSTGTGTFSDEIIGGVWTNAPATGHYLADLNTPTSHVFKCGFVTFRGANVPLQLKSHNPTASILVGNASEAALYNFTAGVTESANVVL